MHPQTLCTGRGSIACPGCGSRHYTLIDPHFQCNDCGLLLNAISEPIGCSGMEQGTLPLPQEGNGTLLDMREGATRENSHVPPVLTSRRARHQRNV